VLPLRVLSPLLEVRRMPAPDKTKSPKKLEKGKLPKSKKGDSKKKGSSNMLLILSGVGVVVLLAVGITIFFVMNGSEEKPLAVNAKGGAQNPRGGGDPGKTDGNENNNAPAGADIGEVLTKLNDSIDQLNDASKYNDAAKTLREALEGDTLRKAQDGINRLLTAIKDKAKNNSNDGAKKFLQQLMVDKSNPSLAQSAGKIYEEHLKQPGETVTLSSEPTEEPTNYLPSKTDVVFDIKLKNFFESEYQRGVFATGAFKKEDIERRLGLQANTINQVVIGGIKDFNQVAGVIRTTSTLNWDDFKKAMQLDENGINIKGKTYYLGKIDFMTEFLHNRMPGIDALRTKAAFWRVDPLTIVYGDETTIKDLIENPPQKEKPMQVAENKSNDQENATGGGGAGGGGGIGGGSGISGLGTIGSGGGGAAGGDGGTSGRNRPGGGSGLGTVGSGGGTSSGGENAQIGGGGGSVQAPAAKKADRFLTIDAKMQRLIRLTLEEDKEPLIIFADKATTKVPVLTDYVMYLNQMNSVRSKEIDTLVIVLPTAKGTPSVRVGVACKTRGIVRDVSNDIEKLLTRLGKEDMRDLFGFDFRLADAPDEQNQQGGNTAGGGFSQGGIGGESGLGLSGGGGSGGRGPGGVPGIGGAGGGAPGVSGGSGGRGPGSSGGIGTVGGIGSAGGGGAGMGVPSAPGGGGAGMGVPSAPGGKGSMGGGGAGIGVGGNEGVGGAGNSGANQSASDEPDGGSFKIERSDEYIIITASVKTSLGDFIDKHVRGWMQQIRGSQEMASGKFRFGDLAASLEYYKSALARDNKPMSFPQGAYPRTFDAERGPRPYPASERVSFLRELLPYIGDDRYFGLERAIDPEQSWRSPTNLPFAQILVPHFLNPAAGSNTAYVRTRGVEQSLAATHFVGMAGVGPDAAYYPKSDPRAGMMGYERMATPDDVKDGLSNTIFMIEADKALIGPWLQGGGATVRGTSNAGNDVGRRGGFSSPNYSGKAGVWVLMGDGSARFLAKDISPEVFKAMCTMAGSDTVGAVDLIASKANLEVTPRSESVTTSTAPKKRRVVEEEDAPPAKK
jgi:hypothetical protein